MHMSHKKRASTALKSMGAAGLAAATIVSGLSFGAPVAMASAVTPAADTSASADRLIGKFVVQTQRMGWRYGYFGAYAPVDNGLMTGGSSKSSAEEAARDAAIWTFPARGTWGEIRGTGSASNVCLQVSESRTAITNHRCNGSDSQTFALGKVSANGYSMYSKAGNYLTGTWNAGGHEDASELQMQLLAPDTSDLSASVSNVNNIAKSAVVSGTATPGATVWIGEQSVDVGTDGKWSLTLSALVVGENDLVVIQKVGNEEIDRKTLSVTIVEGGGLFGVDQGPVELKRGATTQVPFVVENRVSRTDTKGTVTLTAPDGATFSEQDTVQGSWRRVGNTAWNASTSIPLTNGRLSNDNTTLTFDADWASERPADQQYRFMIDVNASDEAPEGSSAMDFVFSGTSSTNDFRAEGKTTTTIVANVAAPTGTVTFSDDVTQKATVSGTGVDGATITLYAGDSTTVIGTAVVNNGTWSTTIDPIGAGDQKIRIEQSGIEGIQTAETTAQYGAAVTLDRPGSATVTPGAVTVTGTGHANTTVTITGGAKPVTTTVKTDGTFTAEVELAPSNTAKTLTAQQRSKGNLSTSDTLTVTPNGAQTARAVVITEPSSHTYKPNTATTISGTATPYATIKLRFQWNDTVYGTATADINGNWSITRGFGPAAKYELTATQTRFDTTTSTSTMFTLDPEGITNQEVVITGPADHAYKPGEPTRVTGTATPFAKIELRFQWNNTVYGTATANADGNWNIVRAYGPAATYELTATQRRADGTTSLSNTFTLEATGIDRPFTLTTPAMDSTFEPGAPVSFTGTGTRGATITAIAPAWNNNVIFTTKVDDNGKWELRRGFAPGITYDLTLVQQPTDGDPTTITGLHLTPTS